MKKKIWETNSYFGQGCQYKKDFFFGLKKAHFLVQPIFRQLNLKCFDFFKYSSFYKILKRKTRIKSFFLVVGIVRVGVNPLRGVYSY